MIFLGVETSTTTDETSFNEFQFWRDPLPSVDLNEVTAAGDAPDDQTVVDCLTGGSLPPTQQAGPVRTAEDDHDDDMLIGSLHEEEEDGANHGESPSATPFVRALMLGAFLQGNDF